MVRAPAGSGCGEAAAGATTGAAGAGGETAAVGIAAGETFNSIEGASGMSTSTF